MTKALIKYLLSFCILLIGVYGYTSTYVNNSLDHFSITKEHVNQETKDRVVGGDFSWVAETPLSSTGKGFKVEAIEVEEDEDDKLSSKSRSINDLITLDFGSHTWGAFFSSVKNILPFYKYFTYRSLSWYLVFQVFRL